MKDKASHMKKEICSIANYRALMISKYYITVMLSLMSLYLGFIRYNISSLYILIILFVMPYALSVGIKDYAEKTGNRILTDIIQVRPVQLNMLQRKYRYSKLNYVSNSITYLIVLLLIGLWQYSYSSAVILRDGIRLVPFLLLLSGLLLRLLLIIFYRIKLPYDLTHNRI